MPLVSLICLGATDVLESLDEVDHYRRAVQSAGWDLELLAEPPGRRSDRASACLALAEQSHGQVVVIVDLDGAYAADDLTSLIRHIASNTDRIALASRFAPGSPGLGGWIRTQIGWVSSRILGHSDPFTGLLASSRERLATLPHNGKMIGAYPGLDFLLRNPELVEPVPVAFRWSRPIPRLGIDDLRQIKRLAERNLGSLAHLIQFCIVGASGMVVDLTTYAILHGWVFAGPPFENRTIPFLSRPVPLGLGLSAALAIGLALTWNFTLNRSITFSYAKSGSILRQFAAYVLSNLLAILVSFTLRLWLPARSPFFESHKLVAAVVGIVAATALSFSFSRWVVFRRTPNASSSADVTSPVESTPG